MTNSISASTVNFISSKYADFHLLLEICLGGNINCLFNAFANPGDVMFLERTGAIWRRLEWLTECTELRYLILKNLHPVCYLKA